MLEPLSGLLSSSQRSILAPPSRHDPRDASVAIAVGTQEEAQMGVGQVRIRDRKHGSRQSAGMSRPEGHQTFHWVAALLLVLMTSFTSAQSQSGCVSLAGSMSCPAFNASSISTSSSQVTGLFPFLSFVSNVQEFDRRLTEYVESTYVQQKYQQLLGCSNVTLTNTTSYYARYTTSVICNAIIQNSVQACGLSRDQTTPLCADSCAQSAISEEEIVANAQLCGQPGKDFVSQIRADFTNCALPADSLSGTCITGEENEPADCGYGTNLEGLCRFCGASSPNATDSCCVASQVESRCKGLVLPTLSNMPSLFPTATSSSTSSTSTPSTSPVTGAPSNGLSGGAIAGIVIGSVVAAALIVALAILLVLCLRRRGSQHGSVFNQPTPLRQRSPTQGGMAASRGANIMPVPGGRVARMTALEGAGANSSSDEKARSENILAAERRAYGYGSESDPYGEPSAPATSAAAASHPVTGRRQRGSHSSGSVFGGAPAVVAAGIGGTQALDDSTTSPNTNNHLSSPDGGAPASGQSEQLDAFRDYYSTEDIHPGDRVAVLWAYQPRAPDEFELERGDVLKIVGIWDDGWATGIRVDGERAEDFDDRGKRIGGARRMRDSGVSNVGSRDGEGRDAEGEGGQDRGGRVADSPTSGEVKAFPLVCVCLPAYWRKTVEGDSATDTTSGGGPSPPRP